MSSHQAPNNSKNHTNDDAPQQQQQQQHQNHHPIIHNPESDIESRLQYLREHRICERLELMVRELIAQRPDEPVLALCSFLKEADRTLGIKTSSSSPSSSLLGNLSNNNNNSNHNNIHQNSGHLQNSARGLSKQNPSHQQQTAATVIPPSSMNNNNNVAQPLQRNTFGSQSSLRSAATSAATTSQPNSPHLGNTLTSNNNNATNLPIGRNVSVASHASNLPPLAVRSTNNTAAADGTNNNNSVNVFQSINTGRTSVTSGRVTSAAANTGRAGTATTINNNNPTAAGNANNNFLERDESARSDLSMFSVQSVDMGEFLSEFRAAHHALFGGTKHRISFQDLADIVDRVAVPLPDTSMLAALFMEMETASSHSGLVVFEGFLSRMAQRIQGRFSGENLAGLFLQLASMQKFSSSNTGGHNSNSFFFNNKNNNGSGGVGFIDNHNNPNQQPQGSTTAASSATSSAQVSRAGSPGIIVSTATKDNANNVVPPSVMDAMILNAQSLTRPSSSAASTDAALVAHTTWVPAKFCVEEGFESLGIRMEDLPMNLVSQISVFLQQQMSSASGSNTNTTTTSNNINGTTSASTGTNLTSPLLPSSSNATSTTTASSNSHYQQQQQWSIQDFVRIANSVVAGPAPLTSHSLYQHTTNINSASALRGGSMSNIASVQDLAYE